MILFYFTTMRNFGLATAQRFMRDEKAEILEKAGIIAAVSVAIIALIALGAMAASALQNASGWFG